MVAGCLTQKDREIIRKRVSLVDVVIGTHNVGDASSFLARSYAEGPIVEIKEEPEIGEEFFSGPTSVQSGSRL